MIFQTINYPYILLLAITFGNLWIWRIFKENFIVGILLIVLNLLLFKQVTTKVQKNQLLALTFIFLVISFIILKSGFDTSIFTISSEERIQQNARHGFYSVELGHLFKNKISLQLYKHLDRPIYKLQRNFFYNLDPNLYFFASHPRERAGIGEFEKYSWILLPLFIVGLFLVIRNYLKVGIYLVSTAVISMFLTPTFYLGPILFFPLINIIVTLGLIYCLKNFKNKRRGLKL